MSDALVASEAVASEVAALEARVDDLERELAVLALAGYFEESDLSEVTLAQLRLETGGSR